MTPRVVENGLGLSACHGGELGDEVVDGVAPAQVVEEGVNGDPCAREAGGAAEDVGV